MTFSLFLTDESIAGSGWHGRDIDRVEGDPILAADLIEQLATAVSASADYFNAKLDMAQAMNAYGDAVGQTPPITVLVNEAMTAWRKWRFG